MRIPFLQATIIPVVLGSVIAWQVGHFNSGFFVGPPFRLAYRGVGEFIVGLNFGPVMTLGAYYVQTGTFALEPFLASLPIGLLIAAVLWVNEFPDMDADKAVGKQTLVLRLGYLRSVSVYEGLLAASYLLVITYVLLQPLLKQTVTSYVTLIVLVTLPIGMKALKVLKANYRDPHAIIPANANTIMLHLSFGILSILGFVIGTVIGL